MIAFLRLEWMRLFGRAGSMALLALALAFLLFAALSWPLGPRWVLPEGLPYGSLPTAWALCALIGIFTFGWDEASGSQEFVVHRGMARARLARLRLLLGSVLALAVPLVGFLLPGLLRLPFDANGSIFRLDAILRELVALSCCISAFAAGAFAASIRARPLVRALLGMAALLAVALSTWRLLEIDPEKWFRTYGSFLGAQAFWCAIFLPSACRNFLTTNDVERALPPRQAALQVLPLCVVATVLATALAGSVQKELQKDLFGGYPSIVPLKDGTFARCDWIQRHGALNTVVLLDADHQTMSVAAEEREAFERDYRNAETLWNPWLHIVDAYSPPWKRLEPKRHHYARSLQLGASWQPLLYLYPSRVYLERRLQARVHVFDLFDPSHPERPSDHRVLVKSNGEPFSALVEVPGDPGPLGGRWDSILLGDPDDGTLWRFSRADRSSQLERVELPGGDRYVGWTSGEKLRDAAWQDRGRTDWSIVVGENGCYASDAENGQRLVPVPCSVDDGEPSRPTASVHVHGPLELELEVRDAEGSTVLFRHHYRPKTPLERGRAALIATALLFRSPGSSLAGFLRSEPSDRRALEIFPADLGADPQVLAGRAPWLLAFHLGAALALATAAGRSLLLRGAGRARAFLWIACIVAGGVGAFVVFTLLEPARARYGRAVPSAARPQRPILLLAFESPRA